MYRLTERTIDKRDDPLLLPEYILEGWTTTLPERFDMQAIIALYADHATHEQFHSEFKTDMDLERLASGKFDTNFLECQLTCVALNLLRLIGQRTLIGLYALLHFMVREDSILAIDEPDNFVALAEIQPWLLGIQDRVSDLGAQVLIASHHPELLNQLATRNGLMVERTEAGPAIVRPFAPPDDNTLTPAEIVARGWDLG